MNYNISVTDNINKMLNFARGSAKIYNQGEVATEHLVFGALCLEKCFATDLLYSYGVEKSAFEHILAESKDEHLAVPTKVDLTPKSKQIFVMAQNLAKECQNSVVDVEHILFCVLMNNQCVAFSILDKVFGVDIIDLKNKLLEHIKKSAKAEKQKHDTTKLQTEQQNQNSQNQNSQNQNSQSQDALEGLGIDLTQRAKQGKIDNIIGRDKEISRVVEILCRKTKNNPCLVGEAGVGKSAVIEGLAVKIARNEVPLQLKNKIIFSFDISGLMAGTKFRGALEKKLRDAIDHIIKQGNIIVFMDEIHTLVQTSSEKGEVSPADILKPYLARGEIKTIGATTFDEYKKYLEKDKALERRFQPVMVEAPTKDDTLQILMGIRNSYESFHGVKISDSALKSAVELADRYITNRNFPDKAIDLVDEASSRAKIFANNIPPDILALEQDVLGLKKQQKQAVLVDDFEQAIVLREKINHLKLQIEQLCQHYSTSQIKRVVTEDDIAQIVSIWTNVPVTKLTETETQKLLNLESILHKRVIGQNDAIANVCKAIRRSRVGIKNAKRPIGSFLFLGPTGVGKTELSKAIAEALFDDENNIVRLDMSEYMEQNSVSKLIGSPPGYVGYEEGGQLTEKVRRQPYCVVLLDEIEKANADVLNLLLQLLDDGRLTDGQGRLVNFENTLIIMTSNVGSFELQKMVKDKPAGQKNEIIQGYLTKHFRPELVNRIDNISLFNSLSSADLAQIASIMLTSLSKKLKQKNIDLKLTQHALQYLITKGYSAEFGARPLRRLIEQEIENVIAEDLLLEKLVEGNVAEIDEQDGGLLFNYI